MAQDTNTPMRIPDLEGGEDAPLPDGLDDQAFVEQVNAGSVLLGGEKPEPPTMAHPENLTVRLPVPVEHPTKGELREAEVRELTGEDEEFFAKGRDDNEKIALLVARGTTALDGEEVGLDVIRSMPIGNRDTLMLAIRRATYGDELELDLVCTTCETENNIIVDLATEVEVKEGEPTTTVTLRRGGTAVIRWPNSDDESTIRKAAAKRKHAMNIAEVNTMLLGRILIEVNGEGSFGEETARRLRMPDRRDIIEHLSRTQPGPLFDQIKHQCVECGQTSPVTIGYDELFR